MKLKLTPAITAGALVLVAANSVYAQYAPPPPSAPFPGFINDYMRKQDPYLSVWDIGGAARVRYELKEGGLGLPPANDFRQNTTPTTQNDNDYVSTKVLARVAYTDKWWGAWVEGRSSETWYDDRSRTGAGAVPGNDGRGGPERDGPVDLHQAYVTLGNHKEFPVSVKVGRQELSYGDERLVGAFAWNNIGRVFDTAKLRWQNEWFAADVFSGRLVLPVNNEFNNDNQHNFFSGIYTTTRKIPKTWTEVYFLARNDAPGSTTANANAVLPFQVNAGAPAARDIYTIGTRIKSATNELGNFDYTVEADYQFGNWQAVANGSRVEHRAYAFSANLGYTFADAAGTPRVALEYDFASGDSNPTDGKHTTFDQLYPTGHKSGGYMDFASWQNIHDFRGIFTIKPVPQLSLAVEGHLFWLADTGDSFYNKGGVARGGTTTFQAPAAQGTGFGRNPGYDNFVGSEIDLIAGYSLNKVTTVEAGYGHFFRGDYIKQTWSSAAIGSRDADWVYVQTVVRF